MSKSKLKAAPSKSKVVLNNDLGPDKIKSFENGLTSLASSLGISNQMTTQLSQTATLMLNNRYSLLSNDRSTLNYMYNTHGIIQTLIDQPVDDAFRNGIIINSGELDPNDIQELQNYIKERGIIEKVKELAKWTRLFGGGGMVIDTDGKSNEPFDIEQITPKSRLDFYPADLWELFFVNPNSYGEDKPYLPRTLNEVPYMYYGSELHKTRVIQSLGKRAPSLIRPQLRGWGLSEVERMVRDFNQYLKNQDLIFELLDQAKIDVFMMDGLKDQLQTDKGTEEVRKRIEVANQIKNYQNALILDAEDTFEQKQLQFVGISEMLQEIRRGIASCLRMPISKIFGQSVTGLNAGEDDIENYNAMIESEIRGFYDHILLNMLRMICRKLFGYTVKDLQFTYHPLRVLSLEQEQTVKDREIDRILRMYDRGLIESNQTIELTNLNNLLPSEIKEQKLEDFPTPPPQKPKLDLNDDKKANSILSKLFKINARN